jgi:hypothetical protein
VRTGEWRCCKEPYGENGKTGYTADTTTAHINTTAAGAAAATAAAAAAVLATAAVTYMLIADIPRRIYCI